jgi:hypothetical protein
MSTSLYSSFILAFEQAGEVRWFIIVVERYLTMLFQNNSTLDIFFFET